MPRLAVSIWLDARPERVYQLVLFPVEPLLPQGWPQFRRLCGDGEPGSQYRWQFRRFGLRFRVDAEVVEASFPLRIRFTGRAGWQMDATVELQPELGGTRLRFQMRYRFPWPLRWLIPGPLVRLGVWHAVDRFRALAEAQPTDLPESPPLLPS
jgi:hypothetical protein